MEILNLDNFISEKKSIAPLTIKQIKELDINLDMDKMKSLPKTADDFYVSEIPVSKNNLHEGCFVVSEDMRIWMYVSKQVFKRAFDRDSDTMSKIFKNYNFSEGALICNNFEIDNITGFIAVTKYEQNLTLSYGSSKLDIVKLYETNFSWDVLTCPKDTETVFKIINNSSLFK